MSLKLDIEKYPEAWSKELVATVDDLKNGKRYAKRKLRKFVNREISEHYYNELISRYCNAYDDKYIKFEPSTFQTVLLIITSILFVVLVWRMVPISNILKTCILCFGGISLCLLVISFPDYLCYFKMIKSSRSALITTIIIFLLFPININIMSDIHKSDYLKSYPNDGGVTLKISCNVKKIRSGSIGDEWSYKHFFNEQQFENGERITFNAKKPFKITSKIIEHDSISDIGESSSANYDFLSNSNYKKKLTITNYVHVVENGGRRYAGSTADFKVIYKLKRDIPPSMNFWDIFLNTSNDLENIVCIFLIIGQVFAACLVVLVFIRGKKKKIYEEDQEKLRKENEFLKGRELFLEKLQGRSIREVAGVPKHITFVNELPIDNNDSRYGSFTVYYASSGKRYHKKRGCCSAHYPIHYFTAKKRYSPCSKCCTNNISVPQWYIDYKKLAEQAAYYQINMNKDERERE